MAMALTETIQRHVALTQLQKVELLDQISIANDKIAELEDRIDDLKEQIKPLKASQETEKDNISQALANYKAGFCPVNVECSVVYDGGMARYYDVVSGELIDEHPITEEEQLRLNENRIDAEKIIRQASNEEDEE